MPERLRKYWEEAARRATEPTIEECEEYGEAHGPVNWRDAMPPEKILARLTSVDDQPGAVLAGDIRRSTFVLKEALYPIDFAFTMSAWITGVRGILRENGGWFGTFTGDGFLAFWPIPNSADRAVAVPVLRAVLNTAQALLASFDPFRERWRRNSKSFPAGVGLSLGIDAGPLYLAVVNNDLTVVGSPVVAAFRMVEAAAAQEIVSNIQFGLLLEEFPEVLRDTGTSVAKTERSTKEFPNGQEAYVIEPGPRLG